MKNKLAIFDLDGTLFDTKDVNYSAYAEALKSCGIDINIDYDFYCKHCNGNTYKVFLPQICCGITTKVMEEIHERKKTVYSSYLNLAVKNTLLFSIIDSISSTYDIAIATTASKVNTIQLLDSFGVKDKFDVIITKEDVNEVKPSPECFLIAMNRCSVDNNNTIIFEDSDVGIEAAKKSGAKYVKVYGYN